MPPQTVAGLVADARSRIEELSPMQLASELECGDVLLVDIREPDERQLAGLIAGGVSAPRGMLEFYADPASPYHREEFERDRRIVLYCASGGRSALATDALRELGYDRVAHLCGGIREWSAAGMELIFE